MKCPKCKYARAGKEGSDCPLCGTRLRRLSPSDAAACSAWIPASNPPDRFSRVIAKNEYDEIAECFWITEPNTPGFYVTTHGGAQRWPHVTHYIPWPNV